MATFSTNNYGGRTITLTVTQSGEYFNWTLTSSGGSATYYTIYHLKGTINGQEIFNYGDSWGWTKGTFPAKTGSISNSVYIGGSSRNITVSFTGAVYYNRSTENGGNVYYTQTTGSFNLNILNPDGSEPYSTGEAGTVEFSSNGGSSYSRIYNEPASSYNIGTAFRCRNFTPGTGRKFSYTSGFSGGSGTSSDPWYATQGTSTTLNIYTAWQTYTISYNAGGGTGAPGSQTKTYGTNLTLSSTKPTRSNSTQTGYKVTFNPNGGSCSTSSLTATDTIKYSFSNWKDGAGTTYSSGGTYSKNQDDTLTAQWGSSTTKGSITLPTASRTYYTFKGWATSSTATSGVTGTYTPSGNVTLYATWEVDAPTAATISVTKATRTKIYVSVGYTGAALTGYTVYYRANSTGSYNSISLGTSSTGTITGLSPNTSYQLYVKATNAKGSKDSSTVTTKTMANTPKNLNITKGTVTPFTAPVTVSGSGDTNANITNYTLYWCKKPTKDVSDMAIKYFDNALWVRVFYHQCNEGGTLFSSLNECRNTQTTDKYSRLNLLDNNTYKRSDGKFEFMLCYPNDFGYNQYNRWKQTNAPQNEYPTRSETGTQVSGYSAVHVDWTTNYWGGLERNAQTAGYDPCYLDGSVGHGNWHYAIGASTTHGYGIPSQGNSTSSNVELWVRIDDQTVSSYNMGTSTSYTIPNLSEETDYIAWVQATNAGGIQTGKALQFTTPADQAKIRRKDGGTWIQGKTYFKKNGQWVKAKKIYRKVNGAWVIGKNN